MLWIVLIVWLCCGALTVALAIIVFDGNFYGFGHVLFIVLCGPVGLLTTIFEEVCK